MKTQVVIFLLVNVFAVVLSYPNGAPSSDRVCKTMNAGHGPGPQEDEEPPYNIRASNKVAGGQALRITISGENGEKIKGLYCQVRDAGSSPIGKFLPGSGYKTGNCGNLKDNAATHTDNSEKSSMSLSWQAPQDYQGQATVVCTVLKDFDTFWTFVSPDNSINISEPQQNLTSPRTFFRSFESSFKRKRRDENKTIKTRKAKILSYNPYAPYPPILDEDEEYYNAPEFVQNFQDPFPESEYNLLDNKKPNIIDLNQQKPTSWYPNVYANNLLGNSLNSNKEKYHHNDNHQKEEDFNENIPHYYNPDAYKTARPAIVENIQKPIAQSFPKEIISAPQLISGFVPNQFPPKGHNHHFYNKFKDGSINSLQDPYPEILTIDNFHSHNNKPLVIHQFPQQGFKNDEKNEFSLIPNAAVLIPSEYSHKNKNVDKFQLPRFGLLVYNPQRGPPHYLIPVSGHPESLNNNKQFGDRPTTTYPTFNHNNDPIRDSSQSYSEPPEIIYGERFTGKNYFFGRKTRL